MARRSATVGGRRSCSAGVAALFMFGTGAPYGFAPEFSTVELRQAFIAGINSLPILVRGLLGEPINIEFMGGFLSWRVGNFLPAMLGLWPVIALSATLAGEAAKGSLDLVVSTPTEPAHGRRREAGRSRDRGHPRDAHPRHRHLGGRRRLRPSAGR